MAKKSTQGSRSRSNTRRSSSGSSRNASSGNQGLKRFDLKKFSSGDTKKLLRKIKNNPVALYLAGGVGALFMAKYAFRFYRNHPEIKSFIKENFDTVESTLREYRGGIQEGEGTEARH